MLEPRTDQTQFQVNGSELTPILPNVKGENFWKSVGVMSTSRSAQPSQRSVTVAVAVLPPPGAASAYIATISAAHPHPIGRG